MDPDESDDERDQDEIEHEAFPPCWSCRGSGWRTPAYDELTPCPHCHGYGA